MPPTVMTPWFAAGCGLCVVLVGLVAAAPLPPEPGVPPELALPPELAFAPGVWVLPPEAPPLLATCAPDALGMLAGVAVPDVAPLLGVAVPEPLPGEDV